MDDEYPTFLDDPDFWEGLDQRANRIRAVVEEMLTLAMLGDPPASHGRCEQGSRGRCTARPRHRGDSDSRS